MKLMRRIGMKTVLGACALAVASAAHALPGLQLTILDGTYVPFLNGQKDETTYAGADSFTLYALMQPGQGNLLSDTYRLSIAVVPQTGPTGANLGTFTIGGGSPISVTGDMIYGVPPLETLLGDIATDDPGDLQTHSIFPTFFYEVQFSFSSLLTTKGFDAQQVTPQDPLTADPNCVPPGQGGNQCVYFVAFDINVAGLNDGVMLHFDLYNTSLENNCTGTGRDRVCTLTDTDINKFAPFSHDAQSSTSTSSGIISTSSGPIPSPGTNSLALLGLGLVAGSFLMRRKAAARA